MPDKTEGFAVRRRIQRNIWIAATIIGLLATVLVGAVRIHTLKREKETVQTRLENEVQQGIAKEIFRLHVVANSDTEEDQNLKLHVKTKIVDYLEGILGEDRSLEATREAVKTHLDEIEEAAGQVIADEGYDYPVAAAVEKTYFPDKTYGDCTFPAGEYEALNVKIGKAEGHNWWCVLYPSLCFLDESHGIVSEEKKEDLREVLTEEEFLTILNDPEKRDQVKIGFKWF
nr:stage II sporulation protein R [Blautia marasmi]